MECYPENRVLTYICLFEAYLFTRLADKQESDTLSDSNSFLDNSLTGTKTNAELFFFQNLTKGR